MASLRPIDFFKYWRSTHPNAGNIVTSRTGDRDMYDEPVGSDVCPGVDVRIVFPDVRVPRGDDGTRREAGRFLDDFERRYPHNPSSLR